MSKRVLIIPGLLDPLGESLLAEHPPGLAKAAVQGRVLALAASGSEVTLEAAWIGLDPAEHPISEGPLVVAAFGADPPEGSVHFHVSIVSVVDGCVKSLPYDVSDEDAASIVQAAKRLETSTLTLVEGQGASHGLVWERGSLDLGTTSPDRAEGQTYRSVLPQGDGEPALRRFIDDSVNLLGDLELNHRRLDDELPPLNCLWPWGHGMRPTLPNLWLSRGARASVESRSLRLAGLARLAGYHHGRVRDFGRGTAVKLKRLADLDPEVAIIVIEEIEAFRNRGLLEESAWMIQEIDRTLVRGWLDAPDDAPVDVLIVAPGRHGGLALRFSSRYREEGSLPFDERTLHEKLPAMNVHDVVASFLEP